MPKFNIYKIHHNLKDALVAKFISSELVLTESLVKDGFNMEFYLSSTPEPIAIWWTELYSDFLSEETNIENTVFCASLLIYDGQSICYAISLGKTHFYLRDFCDSDFGLKLGERIIDEENLKIKNSKFHKSKKNKIITSYSKDAHLDFESGESMHYLKANTINETLWGKIASFGTSALLNIELEAMELPGLIVQIEAKLAEEPIILLPKAELVTDGSQINILDQELASAILSIEADVEIEEFSLSGIDFIFSDENRYSFYKKGARQTRTSPTDLTIQNLKTFLGENSLDLINEINNIYISVVRETGRDYSKPLKGFLEYLNTDRFCLLDGRWHHFNQSYIKYLNSEIAKIPFEYKEHLNLIIADFVLNADAGQYKEDYFNCKMMADFEFINADKHLVTLAQKFKVEKMDLFKDNILFFVKRGTPQKLGYVIDQAINTVTLLQNNADKIELDGIEREVKSICLWLILKRNSEIQSLTDLNSIIFQMKLIDWKRKVQNAGFSPLVWINYER